MVLNALPKLLSVTPLKAGILTAMVSLSAIRAHAEHVPELVGVGLEGPTSWALISIGGDASPYNIGDRVARRWQLLTIDRRCAMLLDTTNQQRSKICLHKTASPPTTSANLKSGRSLNDTSQLLDAKRLRSLSTSSEAWLGQGGTLAKSTRTHEGAGVVVQTLGRGSFLTSLGLKPGDTLLEVNGTPITEEGDLPRATANIEEDHLEVIYARDGEEYSMAARLSADMIGSLAKAREPQREGRQ